jgi:hypothetical protein
MKDLRRRARHANIALAITTPILFIGGLLLRDADEAVLQAFGMTMFFLNFVFYFILDRGYERRHGCRARGEVEPRAQ